MKRGSLSVLVVEDHAMLATSLAITLRSLGHDVVVAEDLEHEAVLRIAGEARPDLVLLDLHLGGGRSGFSLVGPLRGLVPTIVVLTSSHEVELLHSCLESGAAAVLDKAMPFDRLLEAVEAVAEGRAPMLDADRAALMTELDQRRADRRAELEPFQRLTRREAEVLARLVEGTAPKVIARSDGVALSTVRGHIQQILLKLGVSSQREALARARAARWPAAPRE